ncbi:MAG: holo-ACP synthase [Defluviitaleaceae bacterium]|nr:holo-ACP synthase [Defluviitaleaceae bacterium]
MIISTGVDIVKVSRFEKFEKVSADPSSRFIARVYTPREREYLRGKNAQSLAGIFAAKEAVAKALGTGFRDFLPTDIEILHDNLGKPYTILHGNAKKLAKKATRRKNRRRPGCFSISISIAHTTTDAIAVAVLSISCSRV